MLQAVFVAKGAFGRSRCVCGRDLGRCIQCSPKKGCRGTNGLHPMSADGYERTSELLTVTSAFRPKEDITEAAVDIC